MRIVGGSFRGRALKAQIGPGVRPTSDRAREAVFNILEHAPWSAGVVDLRVIDLFAGSGALGLEALSRGAAYCLFVETGADARGAIRDNAEALDQDGALNGKMRIHRRDATDLGLKPAADGEPFDLAFLDPPYGQGLGEQALASLAAGGWLKPSAVCVLERGAGEGLLAAPGYAVLDDRRYGAAQVAFLRFEGRP
ncbi:MAG TPA: 16S rRNA (guanine(966)-N(2))-methyltransferase RsmD [Caulobacteraceae bacterium]|nr:16S rRNA (guanine(966)-N(2))-methyltransferase RsmD [Caulobacteraceae bacterium]